MAKSSVNEEELRRACEAAIEGTKQNIVMSIRVAKSRGNWGKSGKLGRNIAKPRVFALSTFVLLACPYKDLWFVQRNQKPAKLYKLKHRSKVKVITNDPSGCTFTLGKGVEEDIMDMIDREANGTTLLHWRPILQCCLASLLDWNKRS
ncbi:hypothetical protein REPUB_Repub08aG0128100 [Reevesia pubescens]